MSDEQTLRRVSETAHDIHLTGCLLAAQENRQPMLFCMAGTTDQFVLVGSTLEKLEAALEAFKATCPRIMQIEDGHDFLASLEENTHLPYRVRVMLDPYIHANGRIRFLEPNAPPFEPGS